MAEEELQEAEEGTMRDDFLDAIDEVEPDGVDDEHLQEGATSEAVEPPETGETQEETQEEVPAETGEAPEPAKNKAPVGWSPTSKAKWDELPPEVQQQVHEREVAVDQLMAQTADDRRTAQNFNQLCTAYAPVFAGEGMGDNYLGGVQGLMNICAELQQGGVAQKAQRIAGLIQHYGVDIEALDTVLSGQQPSPEQQGNQQIQQYLDQRLAPVNELMSTINQNRQNQQYQIEAEAEQSIGEFGADPQNVYFENVRYAMADFLDMAGHNGQEMSLQEAYDRACAMNPEIAGLVAQQRAAQQQESSGQASRRRRQAASSITGRQNSSQSMTGGQDMRSLIETAWDEANTG